MTTEKRLADEQALDAETTIRNGPTWGSEEKRVEALKKALASQYDLALEEAAMDFDRMVSEGDTEPLNPSAVARLLRERMSR